MNEEMEVFSAKKHAVNPVIVIVTVVAFFVLQLWEKSQTSGTFYGHTTEFLLSHGALYTPYLLEGEWYRLVTYMFLHGSIGHLGQNMLILFFLGNALERYLGSVPYIIVYFFSGILAALGSVVYNTSYPVCVGASGAVFGIVGAMLWIVMRNGGKLKGFSKKQMLLFIFLSVIAGIGDYSIDNAAHVAGLMAGFLLAVFLYRKREETKEEE